MFRRITILLSCVGLVAAIYVVATAKEVIPSPPPAQPPSTNPFAIGIAALGLVEPSTRMVDVAAPESARVSEVFVQVGEHVKAGTPLFCLDTVPLDAEMLRARAALVTAQAEVRRLENWPRPEDFPPMAAEVAEARSRLADAEERLASLSSAQERNAASDDEVTRQRFLVSIVRANVDNAEARLARMRAGSWSQDLEVAKAAVLARQADIDAIQKRLDRMTVRAPIDATVLQRNIEPGEFASTGPSSNGGRADAPIILGDLSAMHVRAQVDEEDAPLLSETASAIARVRGPFKTELALELLRIEPLASPKRQISGASTELVDTRVIEAVYLVKPAAGSPRLYAGQVVDVYIEAADPSTHPAPGLSVAQ